MHARCLLDRVNGVLFYQTFYIFVLLYITVFYIANNLQLFFHYCSDLHFVAFYRILSPAIVYYICVIWAVLHCSSSDLTELTGWNIFSEMKAASSSFHIVSFLFSVRNFLKL